MMDVCIVDDCRAPIVHGVALCHHKQHEDPIRTYRFFWNGRRKFVDAKTEEEAKTLFMERFGFYPDNVIIEEMVVSDGYL
jgi:hypothetical protein